MDGGAAVAVTGADEIWDLAERAIRREVSQLLSLPQLAWLLPPPQPAEPERGARPLRLPSAASLEAAHAALQALAESSGSLKGEAVQAMLTFVGTADYEEAVREQQQQQQQPARTSSKVLYTGEHRCAASAAWPPCTARGLFWRRRALVWQPCSLRRPNSSPARRRRRRGGDGHHHRLHFDSEPGGAGLAVRGR
jgi:hypothetical protein